MEQLARLGRGEAAAAGRSFVNNGNPMFGPAGIFGGGVAQQYASPTTAQRVQQQLQGYVLQGTGVAGGGAGQPPGGGFGLGSVVAAAGNVGGQAASAVSGTLSPLLAMAGLGSLAAMAKMAFDASTQQQVALDTLVRRINDSGQDFERFRGSLVEATKGLGITSTEAIKLTTAFQRVSAEGSPDTATANSRFGVGVARAFGVEPEVAVAGMGRAQFMGVDPKQFAAMVGEAVSRGGQTGQFEDVQGTLLRALESLNRNLISGDATRGGFQEFQGMYAAINAAGVAGNMPGLRGANASNILGSIDASVQRGGNAGYAGQMLALRGFAQYGIRDAYQVRELQEGGMFQRIGGAGSPTTLQVMLEEINRERSGMAERQPFQFRNILQNMLGISMPTIRALQEARDGSGNLMFGKNLMGLANERGGQLFGALEHAGVQLDQANPTSIQDLASIAFASPGELERRRKLMLGREGLPGDMRSELTNAGPDQLRDVLLRDTAKLGHEPTEGEKLRQALADLKEAFISFGKPLTDAFIRVRDILETIESWLNWFKAKSEGAGSAINDALKSIGLGTEEGGIDAQNKPSLFDTLTGGIFKGGHGGGAPSGKLEHITDQQEGERIQSSIAYYMSPEGGGYTRPQAIGIVEGPVAESHMGRDSQNVFQWTNQSRIDSIQKHMKKTIPEASFVEQRAAHAWELSPEGPEHEAGARLHQAKSAAEAAWIDTIYDMRPSLMYGRAISRAADATAIEHNFPAPPMPPDSPPAGGAGGASTLRIDPIELHYYDHDRHVATQTLPTRVTPPQPNNAATPGVNLGPAATQPTFNDVPLNPAFNYVPHAAAPHGSAPARKRSVSEIFGLSE